VIPGDGIGPEVIAAALGPIEKAAAKHGFRLDLERLPYGADHYLATRETLPEAAFRHLRDDVDAIFLGAIGDPRVPGTSTPATFCSACASSSTCNINFRPVRLLHSDLTPLRGNDRRIDFVIFRENTEGVILGRAASRGNDYVAEEVNTAVGVERIIRRRSSGPRRTGKPASP